jgi:hypothetical protein
MFYLPHESTMKKALFPIMMLCWILASPAWGQTWLGEGMSEAEKAAFRRRVKEVSQFMKRFNGEQGMEGGALGPQLLDSAFVARRQASLLSLFHYGTFSRAGEAEQAAAMRFLSAVNRPDSTAHFLDFLDPHWYALADINAEYQGKPVRLQLALRVEEVKPGQSKWVVAGAKADFLVAGARNPNAFLPPSSDGTNFMGLADALEARQDVGAYTPTGYRPDVLGLVLFLFQQGLLARPQVAGVSFHLLQVPGWGLVLKEFDGMGDSPNSGWLVAELHPVLDRAAYAYRVLGIRE